MVSDHAFTPSLRSKTLLTVRWEGNQRPADRSRGVFLEAEEQDGSDLGQRL